MSSSATAAVKALGVDGGLPFPLEDIALADTLLLVGSNATET
jgi:assimilatory nitrate reductase catalytic subunit